MRRVLAWARQCLGLFRSARLERDLSDELNSHIELHVADLVRGGLTPTEARRRALTSLEGLEQVKERHRDGRRPAVAWLGRDLTYAVRALLRTPGFSVTAALTLTLGIGGVTAMFALIHAVLLRPLPYPDPDQLVTIGRQGSTGAVTIAEFELVRGHAQSLTAVAAYRGAGQRRLGAAAESVWVDTLFASTDFLRTLGLRPSSGREFLKDETLPTGRPVAVISDRLWRSQFGADPDIVGRPVVLDDVPTNVVGVLPAEFWFPQSVDVLLPLQPSGDLTDLGSNTQVIGRLDSDRNPAGVDGELSALTADLLRAQPDDVREAYPGLVTVPLHRWIVGDMRLNLWLLFGATAAVLLVTCMNIATLLLGRFVARSREVAVRVALGASRLQLARQWLIENLVLTGAGVVGAVAVTGMVNRARTAWWPLAIPGGGEVRVDGIVLLFAAATAVLVAVVFTLVPVTLESGSRPLPGLSTAGRTTGAGRRQARARDLLVVSQVAVTAALFVIAALLVQSLRALQDEPLGFTPRGLTTFVTPLDRTDVDWTGTVTGWHDDLRRVDGLSDLAVTTVLPLAGQRNVPAEPIDAPDRSIGAMEVRVVTPNYFELLGIAVLQGSVSSAEGPNAPSAAIVSETVAATWWPDRTAVGQRLRLGAFQGRRFFDDPVREVVAVVEDTKTVRLQDAPRPTVYVPLGQAQTDALSPASVTWIVRGDGAVDLFARMRSALALIAPGQRILAPRTFEDVISSNVSRQRLNAGLFSMFGAVALLLVVIGLYGVVSSSAVQRTKEIGVRVAVGARSRQVLFMMVRRGLVPVAAGLVLGLTAAAILTRFVQSLLFQIAPGDPATFAAVVVGFTVVSGAAIAIPAVRSSRVNPALVLRGD